MSFFGKLVWLFFFSLPWTGALVAFEVPSPARILSVPALVAITITAFRRGVPHPRSGEVLFAALVACYLVSYFWVWSPDEWSERIGNLVSAAIAVLIFWQSIDRLLSLRAIASALTWGAGALAVLVVLARLQGFEYGFGRVSAGSVDPNEVAFFMLVGLALTTGGLLRLRNSVRWAYFSIISFAILQTGSRTALVATLAIGLLMIGGSGFSFRQVFKIIVSLGVIGLTLVLAWEYLPEEVSRRTLGTLDEFSGGRPTDRVVIWEGVYRLLGEALPLGVGGGGVASAMIGSMARYVEAHNVFLSLLVQFGLAGVLLSWTLLSSIAAGLRVGRIQVELAALAAVVGLFALTLSIEYRPMFWIAVTFLFAGVRMISQPVNLNREIRGGSENCSRW